MAKERTITKKVVGVDMLAFSAIMTILLAFFIMLTSFIKEKKPEQLMRARESFNKAVATFGLATFIEKLGGDDIMQLDMQTFNQDFTERPVENIHRDRDEDNNLLEEDIEFDSARPQAESHVPVMVRFDDGDYRLNDDAKRRLDEFIALIADRPSRIIVEGRAGGDEVDDGDGYLDWYLSGFRANAVAEYLSDAGNIDARRLSVVGYGKHRPLVKDGEQSAQGAFVSLAVVGYK